MEGSSNSFGLSRKKITGLLLLILFTLLFIFSCTCNVLPFGKMLVGTFGYMVFPLSLIFAFVSLAMFLGFSYQRRIKPTVYFIVMILAVLFVIQAISTYKALNSVATAETLKIYLENSYSSFTLLGSVGSIFTGVISALVGAMGTIVFYVILATIFIGLFIDYQFYGKFEPHVKKLRTKRLREKVSLSDNDNLSQNRPNYSFETGMQDDDNVLSEVSVDASAYEDYNQNSETISYSDDDVVGEITNEDVYNNDQYSSYNNQSMTSFYTQKTDDEYRQQNNFSDDVYESTSNDVPDVYDYDANEKRRQFMKATFGEQENNYYNGTNSYVSEQNPYEMPSDTSYVQENEENTLSFLSSINDTNSQTSSYEENNLVNASSASDYQTFNVSNSVNNEFETNSIDDEISKILNSSEDDIGNEIKNDYESVGETIGFGNLESQKPQFDVQKDLRASAALSGVNSENLASYNDFNSSISQANSASVSNNIQNYSENTENNLNSNSIGFGNSNNAVQPSSLKEAQFNQNAQRPVIPAKEQKKSPYSFNIGMPGVKYNPPPLTLLKTPTPDNGDYTDEQNRKSTQLEQVLAAFNIPAKVKNIVRGPKITRYELSVPLGVSVKKIPMLEGDIARALEAKTIVIKAPIPGSSYVGIELENDTFTSVFERELLESEEYQNCKDPLAIAIGKDISGEIVIKSLAKMVHMLVAGSTGSGKSVFIHNIVLSLIYKLSPDELRLIMIDPKKVEFNRYNGLPHLLTPEVVLGADKAINALKWCVKEMHRRYDLLSKTGYNNIEPYNKSELVKAGQFEKLPYIVIIVDELAEIMLVNKKEVEACIQSLAQLARACGMHMILATQRPSVDIISGVIKNNIPTRVAFSLQSGIDSKTILNSVGAEKLLGAGDMIFAPTGTSATPRLQAAYATDQEINSVIDYTKKFNTANYDETVNGIINAEEQSNSGDGSGFGGDALPPKGAVDSYFKAALKLVMQNGGASVSYLQRRLAIGYSRAAKIIDQMEDRGYIAGATGAKVRQVLITPDQFRQDFGEEFDDLND